MRYIAVKIGTFANAGNTGSYQIFKRREDGTYSLLLNDYDTELTQAPELENNWPRRREHCLKWATFLENTIPVEVA